MKFVLALALLFICAVPVAAADPGERFGIAQHQLQDGEFEAARQAFLSLQQEFPGNVDYIFGHALALARLGQESDALRELTRAIEIAPGYEDLWRTKYNLLNRSPPSADLARFREQSAARFPLATWWHPAVPVQRRPWTVTLGSGIDALDNNFPDWNNQFAEIRYQRNDSQTYAAQLARDERNSFSDVSTGLAGHWSTGAWLAGGSAAFASSPQVVPKRSLEVYTGRLYGDGWISTLRFRYRDFANATVSTALISTEKYIAQFRVSYDLGISRLHGAASFTNHVLTGNWYYQGDASVGLSITTGHEAEAIGGGQVLETDVQGISLNGRHPLTDRIGLQWWLGIHDQGDLYRRKFIGMAISIRI